MKFISKIICLFIIVGFLTFSTSLSAEEHDNTWSKSYDSLRNHFKPFSSSDVAYCEKLIKEILNDLDTKSQCNGDDDCVLIDQDPFGATVPFPRRLSETMKMKMKDYCEYCDDGSFHSIRSDDLINVPVCWKGKCMVKTGLKKKVQPETK